MRNFIEYLARQDFNSKIAKLPGESMPEFTLKAGLKLARKFSNLEINFKQAMQANFEVLKLRKVESHKEIIRYIWDLENMNLN